MRSGDDSERGRIGHLYPCRIRWGSRNDSQKCAISRQYEIVHSTEHKTENSRRWNPFVGERSATRHERLGALDLKLKAKYG